MTGRRLMGNGGHRRDASGHLRTVSALLDLDEFEVVDRQQDRRAKQNVIGVIPKTTGLCPHCGGVCDERHQTRESRVMDLPMGGCGSVLVPNDADTHPPIVVAAAARTAGHTALPIPRILALLATAPSAVG